ESYVRHIVLSALRDPVSRRDFALQDAGAKVISSLTYPSTPSDRDSRYGPAAALRDDLRTGDCWRMAGSSGQLAVGLPELIHVTHVTIDHLPVAFSPDVGEAPRKMFLWGVIDGKSNHALYQEWVANGRTLHPPGLGRLGPQLSAGYSYVLLATFEYDIYALSHVQTFDLNPAIIEANFYFGIVVLEIIDNWGSADTCLYRLRIHGHSIFPST
ncbi:hypothetical protein C8Q80DRAFT_1096880, partial [Daedaleopsis nitida]